MTLITDRDPPNEWKHAHIQWISGRSIQWHWNVIRWLRTVGNATYLSPVSYIVPAFAPENIHSVPVIHDLIAFQKEPQNRKAKLIERALLGRLVRRCDLLFTVSQATKHDLLARFPHPAPERIVPIFAGPMHPHPERNVPDGKTILSVGTLCPRKNQLRLIEAYSQLPDKIRASHRLVLAGSRGWQDQPIVDAAHATPGVEWLGYVDQQTYESLLHTCTVFALPSHYEGFGMQILDALQRGVPVLTSNHGSLRELAEGAACIVDPDSTSSICDGLRELLTDPELCHEIRQKALQRAQAYSWRRTVDLLLQAL
jgi:alpha-1,3-rhamnosyl/mannosyltransferase